MIYFESRKFELQFETKQKPYVEIREAKIEKFFHFQKCRCNLNIFNKRFQTFNLLLKKIENTGQKLFYFIIKHLQVFKIRPTVKIYFIIYYSCKEI